MAGRGRGNRRRGSIASGFMVSFGMSGPYSFAGGVFSDEPNPVRHFATIMRQSAAQD